MAKIAAEIPTSFKWARDGSSITSLSSTYILPEDKRPNISKVNPASIPVVDLGGPEEEAKAELLKACEEYGAFYLVNHGVNEELCNEILGAIVEFFSLPLEQGRAQLHTTDYFGRDVKVYNYQEADSKVPGWSESLTQLWHPSDDSFLADLPANPPRYRELLGAYAKEMGKVFTKVFEWMSEGLGLQKDAIEKAMGDQPKFYKMQSNFFPPCPDPELTVGLPTHNDMVALAIIRQTEQVTGLHIIKDDQWLSVEPLPNAFVCNVGDVIEVLSNGRYKSVRHRTVTSKDKIRVSLATFVAPNKQTILKPIQDLIDEQHPPRYETFLYANYHGRILRPWLYPQN